VTPAAAAKVWDGRDWIAQVEHRELLFLSWSVPVAAAAAQLPAGVDVDTFDGDAFVTLGVSRVAASRPRGFPSFLAFPPYGEAEVRVPVRVGDRPGLWFVSLTATASLLALAARALLHLPYQRGAITVTRNDDDTVHARPPYFDVRYSVAADRGTEPAAGSLDAFLYRRERMFVLTGRGLRRGEQRNAKPWRLQRVEVDVQSVTLPGSWDVALAGPPVSCGYAASVRSRYSRLLPVT